MCASLLVGAGLIAFQRNRALNAEEDQLMSESLNGSKGKSDYSVFHSSHGTAAAQTQYQPVNGVSGTEVEL